ncbi:FkbM family methyltransferase [Falsiroseomonas sp. CW058]|uniref:FkbM family methyltransferase n=1 Tax=Falsiroseomonas sp. CW058 TaxID=3388664 RepID=UPI003D31F305
MARLADLLTLPARIARLEKRLEEAIAFLAARTPPRQFAQATYLGDHTALALLNRRIMLYLDTRGTDIAPHLMTHGAWEPDELCAFERMLRPGDTVLDLGAHLGVFALTAAAAVGPAGQVHAFEPNPRHAGLLRRSVAVNGFADRVTLHLASVGDAAGAATLLFEPEWSGGGFLDAAIPGAGPRADGRHAITTRMVAVDDLLPDPATRLGVAKLDIEGMEGRALRGMRRLLERSPDARLLLEWAPAMLAGQGTPAPEVAAHLAALGFRFWLVGAGGALEPLPAAALAAFEGGIRNVVAARGNPA